jgi:hypothetical protein
MLSQDAKDFVTLIGVCIGVVTLLYTARNTRMTSKTNRARFWLELRDRFSRVWRPPINRPGHSRIRSLKLS